MMSASQAIYRAAGQPGQPGDVVGTCRLCGLTDLVGQRWAAWVKDTFTDHDRVWPGTIVCHACLFCTDDHNVTLQQRTGRDKPQKTRNYSHVVTASGRWLPAMKNEKAVMLAALLDRADPAIVAVISLQGQKHLIPRARVGWWQIEEHAARPDADRLSCLMEPIRSLYSRGATKAMIESGEYSSSAILTIGPADWRAWERTCRDHRGHPIFALAVWLAQKDEQAHDDDTSTGPERRARGGHGSPDAHLARHPTGLQGEVSPDHLEPARSTGQGRRLHHDAGEVRQPDLFATECRDE